MQKWNDENGEIKTAVFSEVTHRPDHQPQVFSIYARWVFQTFEKMHQVGFHLCSSHLLFQRFILQKVSFLNSLHFSVFEKVHFADCSSKSSPIWILEKWEHLLYPVMSDLWHLLQVSAGSIVCDVYSHPVIHDSLKIVAIILFCCSCACAWLGLFFTTCHFYHFNSTNIILII